MKIRRMPYREYKSHYADCKTVPGSYNKAAKSIEVYIPEGREKPSGTRGQSFQTYFLHFIDKSGKPGYVSYKATCKENAAKRFAADCKACGWTPVESQN